MATINLEKYRSGKSRVFSGRDRGEAARRDADLDRLDRSHEKVRIIVPHDVRSVNSSFFLGMFEDSIKQLGEEEFMRKYSFEGPAIEDALRYGVPAALNTTSPLAF
jgi:hypothetical protein